MNDSLFDGEGIEASDLLALHALQQRERALTLQREQMTLQRELIKQVGSTVAKTPIETLAKEVESGQCPHCGGALPDNASGKKFEYCMHCKNRLSWVAYALREARTAEQNDFGRRLNLQRERDHKALENRKQQQEQNSLRRQRALDRNTLESREQQREQNLLRRQRERSIASLSKDADDFYEKHQKLSVRNEKAPAQSVKQSDKTRGGRMLGSTFSFFSHRLGQCFLASPKPKGA